MANVADGNYAQGGIQLLAAGLGVAGAKAADDAIEKAKAANAAKKSADDAAAAAKGGNAPTTGNGRPESIADNATDSARMISGAGDETVTVYRGVTQDHPDFPNAIQGKAQPWGRHNDLSMHNAGNNASNFTSWTTDYETAVGFATRSRNGPGGIVLKQSVRRSGLVWPPDRFEEFKVLRCGDVEGAERIILHP